LNNNALCDNIFFRGSCLFTGLLLKDRYPGKSQGQILYNLLWQNISASSRYQQINKRIINVTVEAWLFFLLSGNRLFL